MSLASDVMGRINRTLNNPQTPLDEKAKELDLEGYTVLSIGRQNVIFGKSATDGSAVVNVPLEVLNEREKLAKTGSNSINRTDAEKQALDRLRGKVTSHAPSSAWKQTP